MDYLQHSAGVHDLDDYFGYDFVDVHSCDMLRRRLYHAEVRNVHVPGDGVDAQLSASGQRLHEWTVR